MSERRVVLVSGARGGLGAAVARALAADGAVVMCGVRRSGDGGRTIADITAAGGAAHETVMDIADFAAVGRAVERCRREFGRLDVLVNNAATIHPIAAVPDTDAQAFADSLRVNVGGAFALSSAAWDLLKKSRGRIINILSGAAQQPMVGWPAYCAGKAALLMLTRSLDLEGKAQGIRCFGFAPGLVDSDMQRTIRDSGINEISRLPRSALSPPENAARVVAWLACGAADEYAGRYVDIRDEDFNLIR